MANYAYAPECTRHNLLGRSFPCRIEGIAMNESVTHRIITEFHPCTEEK